VKGPKHALGDRNISEKGEGAMKLEPREGEGSEGVGKWDLGKPGKREKTKKHSIYSEKFGL